MVSLVMKEYKENKILKSWFKLFVLYNTVCDKKIINKIKKIDMYGKEK